MPNENSDTWCDVRLGDILELRRERSQGTEQLLSVTKDRGIIRQEDVGRRDSSNSDKSTYWRVHPGDIVYNTMRMWQGVVGYSTFNGVVSPAYTVCRPSGSIDSRFITYMLKQPAMVRNFYRLSQGLVSDTWNLKYSAFSTIQAKIPPRHAQQRIAEILDEVDCEIAASQRCAAKLAAVEYGLLISIISKVVESASSNAHDWRWSTVRDSGSVQLGRQRSPEHESGRYMAPYLRVANVFDGFIDYSDTQRMNFTPSERRVYDLQQGDILINEGQSLELVGRCAIFDGPDGMCFQNTLIRYRPKQLLPEFSRLIFKYWLEIGEFARISKQTTSIAHLGVTRFAEMPIPIAPPEEQLRIVAMFSSVARRLAEENARTSKFRLIKTSLTDDLLTGRVRAAGETLKHVKAE
jgi:restriction endonuclease S subunit